VAWLKITWTHSAIGLKDDHHRVVTALGLRKLHQSVVHQDSPSIRGMVVKVKHLVDVEEVSDAAAEELKSDNQKQRDAASKGAR
jgi:large subunit ribosomal protein L30